MTNEKNMTPTSKKVYLNCSVQINSGKDKDCA